MRNLSLNFDVRNETCIATIDGHEAYRVMKFHVDGTDEAEVLDAFYIQVKTDASEKWEAPIDSNELHTEFESAVHEVMERLANEIDVVFE